MAVRRYVFKLENLTFDGEMFSCKDGNKTLYFHPNSVKYEYSDGKRVIADGVTIECDYPIDPKTNIMQNVSIRKPVE